MKTSRQSILLLAVFFSFFCSNLQAQLLAFPGAAGFGRYAIGGRSGSVYHVTNLNNSGTGSLRDAVSAPNRIVVFDVAGVINITSRIVVSNNIYLAGQTAPGEGITVYGNGWSFSGADHSICRYIKIRMGIIGDDGKDANGIANGSNMIFDHCSISWGRDENFSINSTTTKNITIQNCIISQGLLIHSAGGLIQADSITLYRNLYADNTTRNNKVKGRSQYVNNIIYNWKDGAYIMGGESSGSSYVNVTNNCFIKGTKNGVPPFNLGNSDFHIYATDNIFDTSRNGLLDPYTIPQSEYVGGPDFQSTPYSYPALPTIPANTLFSTLLPAVGASLPYRDYADYYVVNEVKSLGKKGDLIGSEITLPIGAPSTWSLWAGTPRTDTDNDGMPDSWENTHGTNPAVNDAMTITASGYANIENYINGITDTSSQPYLRTPMKLKKDSATTSTIYLSWFDYTEKELGYIVERMVNNAWVAVDTTGINENYFTVTGMAPEEADTFRVKAFNLTMQSGYSNELIAKSKPVEVPVLNPATFVPGLTWTGAVNNNWDSSSNNWTNSSNSAAAFTDSSSLLFPESGTAGQSIALAAQKVPGDVLVNSNGNYTFSGTGYIAGIKSLNKMGSGTLILPANNIYTGATVLRAGKIEMSKLANGGASSSIGASANYNFNWVWKGGVWSYTGPTVTTDRSAVIDETTEFNVANSSSVVTFTGVLSGDGGLIKSGPGRLVLKSANPYAGETVINGGILEVSTPSATTLAEDIIDNNQGIGTSNVLRLHNGTYRTTNGSNTLYENYPLDLYVEDSTVNGFEPYELANLTMTVHGDGTLNYAIPYLRELIQGDWSDFTGTLNANSSGGILMIDNSVGFPNNRVVLGGTTKVASYSNNKTLSIGGLSGVAGTSLSCGGTKTPSFGNGFTTYVVGGAGTDETFNGVINNHLYGNTADGNGTTTLIKEGAGIWRLNGNTTHIGTTTVNGGKLIMNGTNSGTGKITVNEGTIFAGKGSVAAEVEVAGTLEGGDSSIRKFTFNNTLTLDSTAITSVDINKSAGTRDTFVVAGAIAYGGSLKINFTGTPVSGDKFRIFVSPATASGTITSFDPAIPAAGLLWKFKASTGEVMVQIPGYVEAPTNLNLTVPSTTTTVGAVISNWVDNADNEQYFIIERSTDSINFTSIGNTPANSPTYTDTTVLPNTNYYYRVKAHGAITESDYSAIVSITSLPTNVAPSIAVNPSPADSATNVLLTGNSTTLGWTANYADSFAVYLGTTATTLIKVATIPATTASYTPASLLPNTKYFWRIDGKNVNGTTTGTVWNFKVANVPVVVSGDFRSVASGNWGTAATWQTFNGTSWVTATAAPTTATATVYVRAGHTVKLNSDNITVNNVVIESTGVLSSLTSIRTFRVAGSINNFGTLGSGSTSTDRVNFEGYRSSGTINITGTGSYYLNTFTVNSIATNTEVLIESDLNLSSYMRAFYSSSPGDNSQNDDNIAITISEGKTVTFGSSGYLHIQSSGSTNTTNTISSFGSYTYNINGTLNMFSTGTTCIVAHSNIASSVVTINVNGKWILGGAIRLMSAATTSPAGSLLLNIGTNGMVDAYRSVSGTTATNTNYVMTSSSLSQAAYFNVTGNGVFRAGVGASAITFPIGSGNVYSPVKITNSGTSAVSINVGVKTGVNNPAWDTSRVVNKQYTVTPASTNGVNLAISLGWITASQASNFNPAGTLVLGRYNNNAWVEASGTLSSGNGTAINPYYGTATGYTSFGSFAVANPANPLSLQLLSFSGIAKNDGNLLSWTTSNELNIDRFELQRSTNGNQFITAGTIAARNGSTNRYEFKDALQLNGSVYYRLRINNQDGSYSFSQTIKLADNKLFPISVYPNPAIDFISVEHKEVNGAIRIFSSAGKLVLEITPVPNTMKTIINVQHLPAGNYILEFTTNKEKQASMFTKF